MTVNRKRHGFYMNKKSGHPSYAFNQKSKMVYSIGFTDSDNYYKPKTKLNYNIDPNSNKACYAKNDIEYYKYNVYKEKPEYRNYRIHKKDIEKIERIKSYNKRR